MSQEERDRELFGRLLRLKPPGEDQAVTARRIGVSQPHYSRMEGRYNAGDAPGFGPKSRAATERAVRALESEDPVERARLLGIMQAADAMQAEVDRLRALAATRRPEPGAGVVEDADGKVNPPRGGRHRKRNG